MKTKFVIISIILTISIIAQSPISKGTFNINGNLYFSSQSYESSSPTLSTLSINPQFGYFVIDNLSLNLSIDYERISIGASTINYGFGPNARYYFDMKNIFPFISLGYSFTNQIYSNNDEEFSGNKIILGTGISYMLTKNVALESILSYSFDKQTLPDSYSIYYRDLEINSNIFKIGVGINFFLY